MSIYPKFDASAYLENQEATPAATAATAAKPTRESENAANAANAATPPVVFEKMSPLETDFAERAAIIEFDGQIPREWAEGFAQLQCIERPSSIPENRWLQVLGDTGRFLDSWGAKLAAFGWTVPEVFGVHPRRPEVRRGGLVWHIRGCKVLAASADCVVVETAHKNKQSIYRKVGDGLVAVWALK